MYNVIVIHDYLLICCGKHIMHVIVRNVNR
jgi:hypothetical protein